MAEIDKSEDLHGKNIILLSNNANSSNVGGEHEKEQHANPVENISGIFDTLDEPISETLKRDFVSMFHKLQYVLLPRPSASDNKNLRNCKTKF
jgi:hypothetical protein